MDQKQKIWNAFGPPVLKSAILSVGPANFPIPFQRKNVTKSEGFINNRKTTRFTACFFLLLFVSNPVYMKEKILLGLFFMFCLLQIGACMPLWSKQVKERARPSVPSDQRPIFPKTNIPLPTTDFSFFLPETPPLEKVIPRRILVSTTFTAAEQRDVSVPDPLLMKNRSSLLIDLSTIQPDEYAYPLPNAKLISPYAGRRRNHSGIDLKTHANDTIIAAFDGIVRLSKPYYGYGNLVVIRHYNGLETLYSHNSKNLVKAGDRVKAGEAIALTGRTGRATTEHLHFEVRVNGQHFNPEMVFDTQKQELRKHGLLCTRKGNKIKVEVARLMPHQLQGSYHPYAAPDK